MKEVNKGLKQLAALDREVARLDRRLKEKPLALRNDQIKLEQTEASFAALEKEVKDFDLNTRKMEKDCKEAEGGLNKASIAQNAATSNEEYQAHQRRIESLRETISEVETKILEAMEQREELAKKLTEQKLVVANAKKILKESETRIAAEIAVLKKSYEEAAEKREAVLKSSLESDDRGKYNRVYQKHGSKTLAQIINRICQGCYVAVRPNDMVRIESGRELVHCGDCGKILYLG
ncbi:MAG: hypothetical protein P1V97_27665 [Planctomycetota bacterium]|nr:hypothetical protein [Planctomycetota bacterium]